jgi:tRNA(Ile2) C34 agmatinyltransferase TiaS
MRVLPEGTSRGVTATELSEAYKTNTARARKDFEGAALVALEGKVERVEIEEWGRYVVILSTDNPAEFVKCDFDRRDARLVNAVAELRKGQTVTLLGVGESSRKDGFTFVFSDVLR